MSIATQLPKTLVCLASLLIGSSALAQEKGGGHMEGMQLVTPTTADPTLKTEYDQANVILMPKGKPRTELVVFLPGTHGAPVGTSRTLLKELSDDGFRVIGLMYNDVPSEDTVCGQGEDLNCSGLFREERFAGDAPGSPEKNTVEDSILHRLIALLQYMEKTKPDAGWSQYLVSGQPAWSKIVITGHSQGGGLAAYIGSKFEVARVVCFSGPADSIDARGGNPKMSTWLTLPTKTPKDRWFAEYNVKEHAAPVLSLAYKALGIPADHVLQFKLEPPPGKDTKGAFYHTSVIQDTRYAPQWKYMFGIEGGSKD